MSGSDLGSPGVDGELCVLVLSHVGVQVWSLALCVTEMANRWLFWMPRVRPGTGHTEHSWKGQRVASSVLRVPNDLLRVSIEQGCFSALSPMQRVRVALGFGICQCL